ncbi:hypothetical protein DUI87_02600 [Hirundo rustica rustica]|uniref:Uncharacterized protein n=1 Tax=Hirundo rustica rustica TaxID=333673 RepID=A0A3M0L9E0_HIRRU|nr:hypothetical protein DUI87_02600 [Hirundo rustica rustica]
MKESKPPQRVEKLPVKVRHVDAHVPKSRANEEHQNNKQVDQAAKIEVSKIDLDWQHKGELFLARWAHDASGHQGRDATYKWARDRGVDLTMDSISQVIHDCETCAAIKSAKRVKPLWYLIILSPKKHKMCRFQPAFHYSNQFIKYTWSKGSIPNAKIPADL